MAWASRPRWPRRVFRLCWGVVTLALLYRLMGELTGRILPACLATILVGLSRTFWLFSSVAQTYTLNAVLMVLLIWLSLRYQPPRAQP